MKFFLAYSNICLKKQKPKYIKVFALILMTNLYKTICVST